jgi:hypothetical protein
LRLDGHVPIFFADTDLSGQPHPAMMERHRTLVTRFVPDASFPSPAAARIVDAAADNPGAGAHFLPTTVSDIGRIHYARCGVAELQPETFVETEAGLTARIAGLLSPNARRRRFVANATSTASRSTR